MEFKAANSELVLHRYYLPSVRGEGWAIIVIGSDGTFTALSDYGNYGYFWSHHGCKDIRQFFLRASGSWDYFVGKFSMGHEDRYNGEATYQRIREHILDCRRHRSMSAESAREEWDYLHDYEVRDSSEGFARWYDHTQLDEAYEYRCTEPSPQVVAFVKEVLGGERFQAMLKAELSPVS